MKRRRVRNKSDKGAPKWMVTYSDMVTLILVFFILLFSMSQLDIEKFEAVSDSFKNRMIFDFYPSPVPMEYPSESSTHQETDDPSNEFESPALLNEFDEQDLKGEEEDRLSQLMEDVEQYLEENNLENVITANRTERGVVLILQESILFDTGEADILESGKPFLTMVGTLLAKLPNHVNVEGHTDDRPISNYRYPSNWELSGARASSVIRYLIEENDFNESRFSAVGYSDTRPAANNSSMKNWEKNRRVEIVILEQGKEEG